MNNKPNIPQYHLWEYDLKIFNFDKSYKVVIERILERGNLTEWREILHYYGEAKILEVIEWSAQLTERDKSFARFFLKSDFIRHNYPLINAPITEDGITFLSLEDIAAMKINAISNSGKRLKDFIDIYYLLECFSMEHLIECYTRKYTNFNPLIAIKAIEYFDDIDPSIDPPVMKVPLSQEDIKARIKNAVIHSKKIF